MQRIPGVPISVTQYHRMGERDILDPRERTELLDAKIITMPPIGSQHADWVDRLNRFFSRAVPETITVRVRNNEPEPDIALLRPRREPYRDAHPRPADVLLIVEVADSTLIYDRDIKTPLYARHGIPEVWVLDVPANRLAIYREPSEGEYRLHPRPRREEIIPLSALPAVRVDLGTLCSFSPHVR
uniref:Endonuclease, Uma2 family (Restriction endonuclease fold) n=1 Tax=Candidatus Kentrum eta TaxID=2126337 RepID=A0A450UI41_9GAMM|nr:MAG: Endonuclease, Uma2 family (restriction endonuclease fold) [Candidatus Kentron sp. H]VFJ92184.1 MAG: Endonuclease, Uma2 family (restriction endonuclease fold) [Candidatus Kentron sp. H]VFJ98854.1 MAG: Endonuclease, Uma2 family (restriction endonuclease fold) [Candidatus Kentron sp. H]